MTALNSAQTMPITVNNTPFAFEIGFFQVEQGRKLCFQSLDALLSLERTDILRKYPLLPLIAQADYGKDQFEQHLFYGSLQRFRESNNGMFPRPTSVSDASEVYSILQSCVPIMA